MDQPNILLGIPHLQASNKLQERAVLTFAGYG